MSPSDGQDRFKVTSTFNPAFGGGYDIEVEDLSTGKCETGWAFNLADVETAANRLANRMKITPEDTKVSFFDPIPDANVGDGSVDSDAE
jgi:hypothetical protein